MKNEEYHTVGTIPKSNRKTKNTILSEQFQNLIEKSQKDNKIKINTRKAHITGTMFPSKYLSNWFNIKTLHRRLNFLKATI